jgi:hypothetical protein
MSSEKQNFYIVDIFLPHPNTPRAAAGHGKNLFVPDPHHPRRTWAQP